MRLTGQTIMKSFDKIKQVIAAAEADVVKFDAGNGAAGTRVRKAMLDIKGLAQEARNEVTELKKKA